MKNNYKSIIAFVVVVLLLLSVISQPVQAKPKATGSSQGIAAGAWQVDSGTSNAYDISAISSDAPSWLQLLAGGIKLTEPSKICHPLRGGQFGWVGEIRQYKDGKWLKLPTVNDWVPNKEGIYMSCAEAPQAGIYALFGYYIRPLGYIDENPNPPAPPFDCSSVTWIVNVSACDGTTCEFYGDVLNVPTNTILSIIVDSAASDPDTLSGSSTTAINSVGDYFRIVEVGGTPTSLAVDYSLPALGCTYRYEHGFE